MNTVEGVSVSSSREEIARLAELQSGNDKTADQLMPLVYDRLRRMAAAYFRHERRGHTLQPTALIHEAYLRLVQPGERPWKSRADFLGIAARVMRQVLVDYARTHGAEKRGGTLQRIDLDETLAYEPAKSRELLALDHALNGLEKVDPRQSRIVELRFFAGLSVKETAKVLGIGTTAVKSDWSMAKAWLRRELDRRTP